MQNYRIGHPTARASRPHELKRHRKAIADTLAKYLESSAVKAALHVADDILLYRPRHDFTIHYKIQEQMQRLRSRGVTARELLQRVVEVFALQVFDERFETPRVMDYAIARHTLQLRSQGTKAWRPTGVLLRYLGEHIREELGLFPFGLCQRIEQDRAVRAAAKKQFETGWQIKGE